MAPRRHLYTLLGVDPAAAVAEISRAYRRLALQYHPDRNPEGAEKFKELTKAYEVLGDPARRAVYDSTGSTGETGVELSDEQQRSERSADLVEQIRAFYATYRDSDDEREDIIKAYEKVDGNFKKMLFEHLLFDNQEGDVERLRNIVSGLIDAGRLPLTASWTKTGASINACHKYQKSLDAERAAAERQRAAMGMPSKGERGATESLQVILADRAKQRAAEWDSLADQLLVKYGGNTEPKKKATVGKKQQKPVPKKRGG